MNGRRKGLDRSGHGADRDDRRRNGTNGAAATDWRPIDGGRAAAKLSPFSSLFLSLSFLSFFLSLALTEVKKNEGVTRLGFRVKEVGSQTWP